MVMLVLLVSAREEAPIPSKAALKGGGGAGKEGGGGGLGNPTTAVGAPRRWYRFTSAALPRFQPV